MQKHTLKKQVLSIGAALMIPTLSFAAQPPQEVVNMFAVQPAPASAGASSGGVDVRPSMLKFHPATSDSAKEFLEAYIPYTQAIAADVDRMAGDLDSKEYGTLAGLAKKARGKRTGAYQKAMKLALAHIRQFNDELGNLVDPQSTYIYIQQSAYLAYLVDEPTNRALAAFPIAYGVKSSLGPKGGKGDLKSPIGLPGERNPGATPFVAHPLVREDPYPSYGCITRGIGVHSKDPRYDFLRGGWTVMMHGTPDPNCMGTRASHGCIRLLPAHITVLFDYVQDGTKIVIVP